MTQRILVLGAENFLGSRLCKALAATDWATPVPFSLPPTSLTALTFEGIHAIFNASQGNPADVLGTARALFGALGASGPRVVHTSSMTVYGSATGGVTEDAPLRPDLGAYGAAQIEAERLATAYPHSVILRPGCEYGPGCPAWSGRIARLLMAHRLGDLGSAGDGVCNLVYIDDLIAAGIRCLQMPDLDGQRFNLTMAAPPRWNEYLVRFGRALGAVPVARIGGRRLKFESRLWAPPLKILELLSSRVGVATPPPLTGSLLGLCGQDLTLDSRRAERSLAMCWTDLDTGLQAAAADYRHP